MYDIVGCRPCLRIDDCGILERPFSMHCLHKPGLLKPSFVLVKIAESLLDVKFLAGVEKLTRSSLKGFFNRALFAYKNGRFASSFLLLGVGLL